MTALPSAALPDAFDVARVRRDFPILDQAIHGRPLVYLDNAATAQKPRAVLEAMDHYYRESNANVHRGVHTLSERATALYEGGRDRARAFLNAREREEIIFVRGTTEAINLVAQSYARPRLKPGDEILITHLEHHSNTVPWQMVCEQTGASLKVVPITPDGALDLEAFERLLGPRTRIFAVAHVSNALGTVNPIAELTARARAAGAMVLIDGAQGVPHRAVDVQALDCDFYAFSAHKLYGPTGIGVLYGRRELLEAMPPWQGGGDMIRTVRFDGSTWNDLPYKFEAGTPAIAEAHAHHFHINLRVPVNQRLGVILALGCSEGLVCARFRSSQISGEFSHLPVLAKFGRRVTDNSGGELNTGIFPLLVGNV